MLIEFAKNISTVIALKYDTYKWLLYFVPSVIAHICRTDKQYPEWRTFHNAHDVINSEVALRNSACFSLIMRIRINTVVFYVSDWSMQTCCNLNTMTSIKYVYTSYLNPSLIVTYK